LILHPETLGELRRVTNGWPPFSCLSPLPPFLPPILPGQEGAASIVRCAERLSKPLPSFRVLDGALSRLDSLSVGHESRARTAQEWDAAGTSLFSMRWLFQGYVFGGHLGQRCLCLSNLPSLYTVVVVDDASPRVAGGEVASL
jgi:hypothetical protein